MSGDMEFNAKNGGVLSVGSGNFNTGIPISITFSKIIPRYGEQKYGEIFVRSKLHKSSTRLRGAPPAKLSLVDINNIFSNRLSIITVYCGVGKDKITNRGLENFVPPNFPPRSGIINSRITHYLYQA